MEITTDILNFPIVIYIYSDQKRGGNKRKGWQAGEEKHKKSKLCPPFFSLITCPDINMIQKI